MRGMLPKIPLIVRLPNWVGDVVMTLPSLQALHHAGFDLHLFGQKWIFDLLEAFPAKLSSIPKSWLQARHELSAVSTKTALLFTNSVSSALVMCCAGKHAIGYKNNIRGLLLKRSITKPHHLHEVEYFWKIAQLAATTWLPKVPWPESIPKTIHLPISASSTTTMMVLCPSATGTAKNGIPKIWPYWSKLSQELNQLGIVHVVCPGPLDEARCRQLTPKAKLLNGLNLSELAALLSHADFVLANDSGPMHLAAAVGANVLGIFGATDPHRTNPWGGSYIGEAGEWPSVDAVLSRVIREYTHSDRIKSI